MLLASSWRSGARLKVALALLLVLLGAAAGALLLGSVNARKAAAAGDPIYMQYGTVQGDVTASGYEHWIELNSFQFGVTTPIDQATGAVAGHPQLSNVKVTKGFDSASPFLFRDSLSGTGTPVTIDFLKVSNGILVKYLEYKLEHVLITSYSVSSGGDRPSESLALDFSKITMTSYNQNQDGTVSTVVVCWDRAANASC